MTLRWLKNWAEMEGIEGCVVVDDDIAVENSLYQGRRGSRGKLFSCIRF